MLTSAPSNPDAGLARALAAGLGWYRGFLSEGAGNALPWPDRFSSHSGGSALRGREQGMPSGPPGPAQHILRGGGGAQPRGARSIGFLARVSSFQSRPAAGQRRGAGAARSPLPAGAPGVLAGSPGGPPPPPPPPTSDLIATTGVFGAAWEGGGVGGVTGRPAGAGWDGAARGRGAGGWAPVGGGATLSRGRTGDVLA